MLQKQTQLIIKDNSGVKKAQCIQVYNKKIGTVGDLILVSVKQIQKKRDNSKISLEKGSLYKALIIGQKNFKSNLLGTYTLFNENSAILLDNQNQPIGTRILGPIPLSLRFVKKFKLIAIGSVFI